ncbi:MAG: MTAP family purine nucleoside phosphorylase [Armatimonadetes bacterium]|nr:MTAP family purine nucleoside phosphorylase [Armatimonadota bacterium]MDE2205430.1 MTAP family purine nucleoside phosphorylase [Armatimonadota bacterium]
MTDRPNFAIVGGTGLDALSGEIWSEPVSVRTSSGEVTLWSLADNYTEPHHLYFLPRHGQDHQAPPHEIDHFAHVEALESLAVGTVLATNAAGSLRPSITEGSLVTPHDFISFMHGPATTMFRDRAGWQHTDFTNAYSETARQAIWMAADDLGLEVHHNGVYLGTDGPRFETPAEVRMFAAWGADVVGMTGVPEAILCREAGLRYASLTVVTNMAAGLGNAAPDHASISAYAADSAPTIMALLMHAIRRLAG